jgi:hypothetical protein
VADVFRRYGDAYREQHGGTLSTAQRRVMTAIEICRTAALGGHVEHCDSCGHQRICYSSCRNRHCPKCQSLARAQWLEDRRAEVLDTQYFHVVFTLPAEMAAIAAQNNAVVYSILFRTVASTRIFTWLSPAAGCRRMATDGSPAGPAIFCRCGFSRGCSGGFLPRPWRKPSAPARWRSSPLWLT